MKLTILGSGTCVPSVKRASPSIYLEIKDKKILLDIGPGSLRQLAKVSPQAYQKLDIVFISHRHTDHISDLRPLVQALNWTPGFTRRKKLNIVAHQKTKPFINSTLKESIYFKSVFYSMKKTKQIINGIKFETIQGNHNETSLIVKITYNKKTIVYTADTDYNPDLSLIANKCDLLITENSFPAPMQAEGHLNSFQAAEMATLVEAKKLLLTHFYPPADTVDIRKQVQSIYKGPIILAKDLLIIKL
ncbi:MAG: MBL fold metallo-hydrolase [Candidatus Kerfeldbacteria bacterium]